MKNLLLILALMTSLTATASAPTDERFILGNVEIDGQPQLALVGVLSLTNDESGKERMRLEIFDDPCSMLPRHGSESAQALADRTSCECRSVPSLKAEFDVQVNERADACGSIIRTGSKDDRVSGGARQELRFVDHSSRRCKDLVPSRLIVIGKALDPATDTETIYRLME